MTTLTITLELPEATEPVDGETEIVTWGRLEELLTRCYLPANKELEIRKGLSGYVQHDLMIGKLTIDVTDPYVEPKAFAPGTVALRKDNDQRDSTTFVRTAEAGRWTRAYNAGPAHLTSPNVDWDKFIARDIAEGMTTIIFDPTQN